MNRRPIKHHMEGLMVLLLFGVFAVCVLTVLLTGANVYRRITERDQAAYDRRTCVQYVATRVRQADCLDAVSVSEFGGQTALEIRESIDGVEYLTRVYYYDGYLRELFSAADVELEPEAGEEIMEAQGLELTLEDGLLTVTATDDQGTVSTLVLSLRSGEGAAA